MVDIYVSLREQGLAQQPATNATQTWIPTVARTVASGLLLPAPHAEAFPAIGAMTFTGVEPCDGLDGWAWTVTTTVDGVIRDQRTVLVPDQPTASFAYLEVRDPSDLRSLTPTQAWVSLDPPPDWFKGWWLVSAPGNPAMGDNTGSGDLRSVS